MESQPNMHNYDESPFPPQDQDEVEAILAWMEGEAEKQEDGTYPHHERWQPAVPDMPQITISAPSEAALDPMEAAEIYAAHRFGASAAKLHPLLKAKLLGSISTGRMYNTALDLQQESDDFSPVA